MLRIRCWTGRHILGLAVGLLSTGCYAYVPVEFQAPQQGTTVRAELTQTGEREVVPLFGPGVRQVEGMFLEHVDNSLSVLIDNVQSRQGNIRVDAQTFRLQQPHISELYERRMSIGRSVLFGVGVIAGGVLLIEGLGYAGRQFSGDDDGPPGSQNLRIPVSIGR
jgi:hypothetical protein